MERRKVTACDRSHILLAAGDGRRGFVARCPGCGARAAGAGALARYQAWRRVAAGSRREAATVTSSMYVEGFVMPSSVKDATMQ